MWTLIDLNWYRLSKYILKSIYNCGSFLKLWNSFTAVWMKYTEMLILVKSRINYIKKTINTTYKNGIYYMLFEFVSFIYSYTNVYRNYGNNIHILSEYSIGYNSSIYIDMNNTIIVCLRILVDFFYRCLLLCGCHCCVGGSSIFPPF